MTSELFQRIQDLFDYPLRCLLGGLQEIVDTFTRHVVG